MTSAHLLTFSTGSVPFYRRLFRYWRIIVTAHGPLRLREVSDFRANLARAKNGQEIHISSMDVDSMSIPSATYLEMYSSD